MKHRCIDESQLDRLLELAEDHPDRREANSCARCRTLLTQYAAFKAGHVPDEARYDEAEPALERFKESLFSDPAHKKHLVGSTPLSFLSLFRGSRGRFALGVTAAALAVFVAIIAIWAPWSEREVVLRSESPDSELRIELPELWFDDSDTVKMSWPPVRNADSYRVTVYTMDFELVFSETTIDTVCVLRLEDLSGTVGTDDILQWRVEALQDGEVFTRSQPGIIRSR